MGQFWPAGALLVTSVLEDGNQVRPGRVIYVGEWWGPIVSHEPLGFRGLKVFDHKKKQQQKIVQSVLTANEATLRLKMSRSTVPTQLQLKYELFLLDLLL